jgi:hypothetical protein
MDPLNSFQLSTNNSQLFKTPAQTRFQCASAFFVRLMASC